jgi:hypothetical protein
METKQTAVEWLENILHDFIHPEHGAEFWPFIEKAKAMEKEQHGETWDDALDAFDARGFNRVRAIVDFDDYWKEKKFNTNGES